MQLPRVRGLSLVSGLSQAPRPRPQYLLILLLLLASTVSAAPLPTRDQNPLLAGFGLPRCMPMSMQDAPRAPWQLHADFNWGSSAIVQDSSRERLMVDAETRELNLGLTGQLSHRLVVSIDIPWHSTSAGSLDSFIDGWHDFFGLPEGERNRLPTDDLQLFYERDGVPLIDQRASMSGIGDITVATGWQWLQSADTSLTTWFGVKLPTGDSDDLTGSDAMDFSIVVAGSHRLNHRWSVFGQGAVTRLGEGDVLAEMQRTWVTSGSAGISVEPWKKMELTLQLDAHSAVFDASQLDYLNEAVILSLGGAYRLDSGWLLSAAVSEDVLVEASPDVVFVLGVSRAL